MQNPSIFNRSDTLLGVCEALGEDFGFNADWLRLVLAVLLLVNPVAVIAGYCAVGALVALSRWLAPNPRPKAAVAAPAGRELLEEMEPEPLAAAA